MYNEHSLQITIKKYKVCTQDQDSCYKQWRLNLLRKNKGHWIAQRRC